MPSRRSRSRASGGRAHRRDRAVGTPRQPAAARRQLRLPRRVPRVPARLRHRRRQQLVLGPPGALDGAPDRSSVPAGRGRQPHIVERASEYAAALAELGGSVLLVRPSRARGTSTRSTTRRSTGWPSAGTRWDGPPRSTASAPRCTSTSCPPCAGEWSRRLLERTDPALVGVALDTGELAVAGMDPVEAISVTPTGSGTCSSRTLLPSTTGRSTYSRTPTSRPGPRW